MISASVMKGLMSELFRIINNLAPPVMDNMFTSRVNNFDLRNFQEFATERKKTVHCYLETVSFCCSQLSKFVPDTLQNSSSLIN